MPQRDRPISREPTYKLPVADLRKNAQERLRIELHDFNGHDLISLRIWLGRDDQDTAVPSTKGVTVSAALIPQLRQAFEDAERLAVAHGILNITADPSVLDA